MRQMSKNCFLKSNIINNGCNSHEYCLYRLSSPHNYNYDELNTNKKHG